MSEEIVFNLGEVDTVGGFHRPRAAAAHAAAQTRAVRWTPPAKTESTFLDSIAETARRRAEGLPNLFQSHMLDASELPLKENMELSKELLQLCADNEIILEVEAGVVGGEEDGAAGSEDTPDEDMYTTPEDMVAVHEALSGIGRFTFAATSK